jgi:hypothetical protein
VLDSVRAAANEMVAHIQKAHPEVKIKKIKVRSSANVEDIPDFDGAGLHDSFGAKLAETETGKCRRVNVDDDGEGEGVLTKTDLDPPSLGCAIRAVYASLWNKRAIEERTFHGLDHRGIAMGLAVVPSYNFMKKEGLSVTANSVVLTRVLNTENVFGYTLMTHPGNNLVTNPIPGTKAENAIGTFGYKGEAPALTYLNFAKPHVKKPALKGPVLSRDTSLKVLKITQHIEKVFCINQPKYYGPARICDYAAVDPEKEKSLDLEYKFLGPNKDHILCKQVREFSGH